MARNQHAKDAVEIKQFKRQINALEKEIDRYKQTLSVAEKQISDITAAQKSRVHFERKEVIVIIAGLIPSLAGLAFNDLLAVRVLSVISWGVLVYACIMHKGSWKGKLLCGCVATLIYAGIEYRSYIRELARQRDDAIRELAHQRDDAYNRLDIEMLTPYLVNSPPLLFFSVKNGGETPIIQHRNTCIVNKIVDVNNGAFVVFPKGVQSPWHTAQIGSGGDAQTDRCAFDWMKFNGPVVCVDVTIKTEYYLRSQPNMSNEKQLRFITTRPLGQHWFRESATTPGNFCDGSADAEMHKSPS